MTAANDWQPESGAPPPGSLTEYPHPARAWWAIAVFCFAAVISYTDRLILSALVDPLKRSLGVGDSAVGLLQGVAFVLVYVCSGLFLGRLADQKRRLTIMVVGGTVWCVGTVACGLAPSFWALALARAIVGVGEAALAPAAVSIVVDSFPPARRGLALSIFFLGFFIGGPASIAVGGVMLSLANAGTFEAIPSIGALEPWRAVLVLVGLAGLAVPALFMTLREPARQTGQRKLPLMAMLRRLAVDRHSLVSLYLAMGLLSIGDYAMFAWVPSVLSRRFAMSPSDLGQVFGAITAVSGAVGCVIAGVASDAAARRHGARGRLFLSLCSAAAAALGAALICGQGVSFALLGLGIWTLFSTIGGMSGIAALPNLIPSEYSGTGIAVAAFCNVLLGLGAGPTLVALVTENILGDPVRVGLAITAVALPAGGVAALLFLYAGRAVTMRERSN